MPTRDEVLAAINTERVPGAEKDVEDWLVYIRGYYNDLVQIAAHVPQGQGSLDVFRKLAALCTACLEFHGGWERKLDGTFRQFYPGPLSRDLVYALAGAERNYQNVLPSTRTDGRAHSVNGYIVMFGDYLTQAFNAWTRNAGDQAALQVLGKLLGIGIHCMEDHGAPPRVCPYCGHWPCGCGG